MKGKTIIVAMLIACILLITACGGGGTTESANTIDLTADKTQAIADTVDEVTLTATVKDSNGAPVAQRAVLFNVETYTDAGVNYLTRITDVNGQATFNVRRVPSPMNGDNSETLKASASTEGIISNEVTITFTKPIQNASSITLTVDKTTLTANNIDTATFSVTVKDSNGIPLAGQLIDFPLPSGSYNVSWTWFTNSIGQSNMFLRRDSIGLIGPESVTVVAKSGNATSNAVVVTFVP